MRLLMILLIVFLAAVPACNSSPAMRDTDEAATGMLQSRSIADDAVPPATSAGETTVPDLNELFQREQSFVTYPMDSLPGLSMSGSLPPSGSGEIREFAAPDIWKSELIGTGLLDFSYGSAGNANVLRIRILDHDKVTVRGTGYKAAQLQEIRKQVEAALHGNPQWYMDWQSMRGKVFQWNGIDEDCLDFPSNAVQPGLPFQFDPDLDGQPGYLFQWQAPHMEFENAFPHILIRPEDCLELRWRVDGLIRDALDRMGIDYEATDNLSVTSS